MGKPKTSKSASAAARRARVEEMRRAEQARDRRNRIIAITAGVAVVAAAVGFGSYLFISASEKKAAETAALAAPLKGEKAWDKKKLARNHVNKPVEYPMTPAVGGDHSQAWMNCEGDVYDKPVANENAVHSLEHGAVWVTYNNEAAKSDVEQLSEKVAKTPYTLMSPLKEQSGAITLSAWGRQLTVDKASDPRVETFFKKYVQGKQTPEPGAACTGGLGAA